MSEISNQLIDICDVSVDKTLPKEERIGEFVRQIEDPHNFMCGEFIFHANFKKNGPSFEACLRNISI